MSAVPYPTASKIWMRRKTVHWRIVSSASRWGTCLVDCLGRKKKLDINELWVRRESLARGFQGLIQGLEFGDRGRMEIWASSCLVTPLLRTLKEGRRIEGLGNRLGFFRRREQYLRIKKEESSEIVTFLLISAFTEREKNDMFGLR